MQYKVPQNVDIEDKVIGPLTIRQFIIVLVAAGGILVLRFILVGPLVFLFWILAPIIAVLVGGLAFGRYGDQNMEVFLLSAYKTFTNPRKRVWKKELVDTSKIREPEPVKEEVKQEVHKKNVEDARSGLSRLAEIVDSGGYSSINTVGHVGNIQEEVLTEDEASDILAKTETSGGEIDIILNKAATETPKREQLVSEVASVPPDKRFKEEPKIILRGKK